MEQKQEQEQKQKQEYAELRIEVIRFKPVDIVSISNTETPRIRS